MNFSQAIRKVVKEYIEASMPTDIMIATVTTVDPISISLNSTMAPITISSIKLTSNCIEKTIDVLEHEHSYYDSDTGDDSSGSRTRKTEKILQNVQVYDNGVPLGRKGNKLIINKGLAVGDKVLVIQANAGNTYVILSKLY